MAWGSTNSNETLRLQQELRHSLDAPTSAAPDPGQVGTPAPPTTPDATPSPSCQPDVVTDDYGLEVQITTCD